MRCHSSIETSREDPYGTQPLAETGGRRSVHFVRIYVTNCQGSRYDFRVRIFFEKLRIFFSIHLRCLLRCLERSQYTLQFRYAKDGLGNHERKRTAANTIDLISNWKVGSFCLESVAIMSCISEMSCSASSMAL